MRARLVPAVVMSTIAFNITTAEKLVVISLLVLISVAVAIRVRRRRDRGLGYN
jgi:hypothetical protein